MDLSSMKENNGEFIMMFKEFLLNFFKFCFHTQTALNGCKTIYIFGMRVFAYKSAWHITLKEENKLKEIERQFPEIMSFHDMLDKIKKGASLARFGDGEFDIALHPRAKHPYQNPSKVLSKKLWDILNRSCSDDLLIAIPPFNSEHNTIQNYHEHLNFWQWYWLIRWDQIRRYISRPYYANSFFSRDAVFYELSIEDLTSIWNNKKVCFVIPQNGRFFYDKRLFDGIVEKSEIYVPPTSAFSEYDRVLAECLTYSKDTLFFICSGPMATVLAVELSDKGYQALDMGHFPNCYLEFLGEADRPEVYPMKK